MHLQRDQATFLNAFSATALSNFASSATTSPTIASPTASSTSPARAVSVPSTTTFTASTIIVVLSLLIFSLWAIAFVIFAPSLRKDLLAYFARKRQQKQAKQQPAGLGFGYHGLSQGEFDQLMRREEEQGARSFVRLPPLPPSLQVIHPLPPISIDGANLKVLECDEKKGLQLDGEPYSESAPAYEA